VPYPLFIPPEPLSTTPREDWTRGEADRYRYWLLSQIEPRTNQLVKLSGVSEQQSIEEFLLSIGKWAEAELLKSQFSFVEEDKVTLSNAGYALAADLGLLVANMLTKRYPYLEWQTVTKPKNDISYNMPVLVGFITGLYLNPVGGSIGEAFGILNTDRDYKAWHDIFIHWGSVAKPCN
jgi:hypothetical protein